MPYQGWKLHISISDRQAKECLQRTAEILTTELTPFKFLVDEFTLQQSNGKLWPRTSSGKFITVYPRDVDQFGSIGEKLKRALNGFRGPHVLTDRRWPGTDCLFYRYGAFRRRQLLRPDGTYSFVIEQPDGALVDDRRNPYWDPPEWIVDPVAAPPKAVTKPTITGPPRLNAGRFSVTSALQFSNRGGVYRGVDQRNGNEVVIKESRPFITLGRHRIDAIEALEKEHRLLRKLADTGRFVRPVDFFRQDGHAFLVEEFISGRHLGQTTIAENPLYRGSLSAPDVTRYLVRMTPLWRQVAEAICVAHDRDIILGDLSFANIIVNELDEVRLIDLECAFERGVDRQVGLFTPGMASPTTLKSGIATTENDYHALGAIIFGSIMLATSFCGFYPEARARFLDELKSDLALPHELMDIIAMLDRSNLASEDLRQTGPTLIQTLSRPASLIAARPRLESPALSRLSRQGRKPLVEAVTKTVSGIESYLVKTADATRHDRLFPSDLSVFETNPLSIAFGAAGVLYALKRMKGSAPSLLVDWLSNKSKGDLDLPPGLYLGQAGVAWVLNELGLAPQAISLMRLTRSHDLLQEESGILIGCSGYGLACLKLWSQGLGEEFLDDAVNVGTLLLSSAIENERGVHWRDSDGGISLGYGHGASGIALFLLYLSCASANSEFSRVGRRALDFDLSHCIWQGQKVAGFPARVLDDLDGPPVVPRGYWDAGSAGILTSVVRYLAVTGDTALHGWLDALTSNVCQKYAVFPQLFHGLAGLGNSLLDAWDLLQEDRYLAEAWQVAEGVQLFRIDRPEGIGFPGEQGIRESCDFATGGAGVGLFLDRLLKAEAGVTGNFNFVVDELLPSRSG